MSWESYVRWLSWFVPNFSGGISSPSKGRVPRIHLPLEVVNHVTAYVASLLPSTSLSASLLQSGHRSPGFCKALMTPDGREKQSTQN